jgi:hypothetical protein
MKYKPKLVSYGLSIVTAVAASAAILSGVYSARAADKKPAIDFQRCLQAKQQSLIPITV